MDQQLVTSLLFERVCVAATCGYDRPSSFRDHTYRKLFLYVQGSEWSCFFENRCIRRETTSVAMNLVSSTTVA